MATEPEPQYSLTLDRSLHITGGDRPLLELAERSTGGSGGVLALPALAAIAHVALKLSVPVSRAALVADGPLTRRLWVRAMLEGEGLILYVTGWNRLLAPAEDEQEREDDTSRAAADWQWRIDGQLRLTALSNGAMELFGKSPASLHGQPLTGLFRLLEEENGRLPLLDALADRAPFEGQLVTVRDGPGKNKRFRLRGNIIGNVQRFGGYSGSAHAVIDAPLVNDLANPAGPQFGQRLDDALIRPLDEIVATAESIRAQLFGPIRADYAGYAEGIAGAGQHLRALVDELVDTVSVDRGEFAVEGVPIDLCVLADQALALVSVEAVAKNIVIGWEVRPTQPVVVYSDARRTLQILLNLIGNAVKYTQPGGHVALSVQRWSGRASLTVADSGPGLTDEEAARVFERYERLGKARRDGSGLGLYIARTLAVAMAGDLRVESAANEGARFTLELPAA